MSKAWIECMERWGCDAMGNERGPGEVRGWRRIDIRMPGYDGTVSLTLSEAEAFSRELTRVVANARAAESGVAPPRPKNPLPPEKAQAFVTRMADARARKAAEADVTSAQKTNAKGLP